MERYSSNESDRLKLATELFNSTDYMFARKGIGLRHPSPETRYHELQLTPDEIEKARDIFAANCVDAPESIEIILWGLNPNLYDNGGNSAGVQIVTSHSDVEGTYHTMYTFGMEKAGEAVIDKTLGMVYELNTPESTGLLPSNAIMNSIVYEDEPVGEHESRAFIDLVNSLS